MYYQNASYFFIQKVNCADRQTIIAFFFHFIYNNSDYVFRGWCIKLDVSAVSGVQSIDRIFLIVELLSMHPKGISLTEICSATDLPKGTVSRMLAALISHGYAVQEIDTKRYRLTMRLFEIGSRVAGSANILSVARPYLEYLSNVSGEAVHLVSRVNDEVVYLYKEEASNSIVRMSSFVGLRNPMYCTGVGKSILAFLPDDEIRAIWQRTKPVRFTENTITTLSALDADIRLIRQRGYAIDDEEHEAGVRCIAAPILNFSGSPVAAISLSAPAVRLDDAEIQKYAPMVLDAASNISRYFGN